MSPPGGGAAAAPAPHRGHRPNHLQATKPKPRVAAACDGNRRSRGLVCLRCRRPSPLVYTLRLQPWLTAVVCPVCEPQVRWDLAA